MRRFGTIGMLMILGLVIIFSAAALGQAADHRAVFEERERLIELFRTQGAGAVAQLAEALDKEPFLSRTAAHLLVRIGEPAREGIEKALEHPDFRVRRIIIDGLSEQGMIEDYWGVVLMDQHPSIRKDVQLFHMENHPLPTGRAYERIIERLADGYEGADADRRRHIVETIATLSPLTARGRQLLEKASQDPEPDIREFAFAGIVDTRTALFFNGEDSMVEAQKPLNIGSDNFTYEIWFQPHQQSGAQVLMGSGRGDNPGRRGVNLRYTYASRSTSLLAANHEHGLSMGHSDRSAAAPDQWTHVAAVVDRNDKARLYVNGVLVSEADATPFGDAEGFEDGPFRVGRRPHSPLWFFRGAINEVRVWNTARTEEQIRDNMKQVLTGNEDGLLLYWPMNEGEGDMVRDKSPNQNHGEIMNATWLDQ